MAELRTIKDCGCRIFKEEAGTYDIEYCPIHKSAEDSYKALEALYLVCRDVSYTHTELIKARQVIAEVKGGK